MHHNLLIDMACAHANCQLLKLTASHFWVLNTENANENMPNMILIAWWNENEAVFNEDWMAYSPTAIQLMYKPLATTGHWRQ